MKIHYCCMTQDELHELTPNIKTILPYVDTVTIIDGGSSGNVITYMRNWSQEESKIRYYISPWENNFPAQRNKYLDKVNEIAQPGDWILVTDPDEYIEESSLAKMRGYIDIANKHNKNMIGFQCRSVSLKGEKRVWENLDNYWKRFLIKWNPSIRYSASGTGTVHEHLVGFKQEIWDPGLGSSKQEALVYEHRKQQDDVWRKGARNLFTGGGGPNGMHSHIDDWKELRAICSSLNLNDWHSYYKYLLKGNADQRLKDWMIKHCQDKWGDGSSEFREMYKTYYLLLHPEEIPDILKGIRIE